MRRLALTTILAVIASAAPAAPAEAGGFLGRLGRVVGLDEGDGEVLLQVSLLQEPESQPTPSDVPPAPGEGAPPAPGAVPMTPVPSAPPGYLPPGAIVDQPAPLYGNVRVKDRHRIHPCAVPTVVCVADPCNPCCGVFVEVCVPPCECVCVETRWKGRKTTLEYGDYEIDIVSFRSGQILVDYDD